jgi:hypothetical protein
MADRVHRITMFKMPREEDQQRMLVQYREMAANNRKVRRSSSLLSVPLPFLSRKPPPRSFLAR